MATDRADDKQPQARTNWRLLRPYERARLAIAAGALAAPLLAALLITPDARGHGTHEQLGLPPCIMMEFFGVPCALCGMTTAFAWFVRGHPVMALLTQPAGALLAALLAATLGALGFFALLGRLPAAWPEWIRPRPLMIASIAILAVAWIYKILPLLVK